MAFVKLDQGLLTMQVKRWRLETDAFHLPHGEVGLKLQDITIQLDVPIDGRLVIRQTSPSQGDLCKQLLGAKLVGDQIKGKRVSMSQLRTLYLQLLVDEEAIRCKVRIHILFLIGGLLFPYMSFNFVHLMSLPLLQDFEVARVYRLGLKCFAWLYRD